MRSCSRNDSNRPRLKKADTLSDVGPKLARRYGSELVHAAARGHRGWGPFLGLLGHHRFGRDQQARDRGGILQCQPDDLGRVDDAGSDHVDILAGLRIEAAVVIVASSSFPTTIEPSAPAFSATWRTGDCNARRT